MSKYLQPQNIESKGRFDNHSVHISPGNVSIVRPSELRLIKCSTQLSELADIENGSSLCQSPPNKPANTVSNDAEASVTDLLRQVKAVERKGHGVLVPQNPRTPASYAPSLGRKPRDASRYRCLAEHSPVEMLRIAAIGRSTVTPS